MLRVFFKAFVFISMAVALVSCGGSDKKAQAGPPPAIPVNTIAVSMGSGTFSTLYPANVVAVNTVEVRPQVAGYVTGIFFKEGQFVKKGQKLYSIDQQQYLGAYEQAVANLSASQAGLVKAQQDADRYNELLKQDAVAKQLVDHANADLETAKKQVDASKANVASVQTNLRYTTLYAPYSGTIGISQVKLGTSVAPGTTVMNTISSDDPIAVDVALNERLIPMLVKADAMKASKTDSTFTLVLSDQSKYEYPGHILIIDRAVDPQSGTIKVRLQFPNPKKMLRDGMTCNVSIKNKGTDSSMLIPYKAVLEQVGEFFVYTVNGDSVHQQKVILGQHIRDQVVVLDSLKVGEIIVTDGIQKVKEGAKVNTKPMGGPKTDSSASMKADSTQNNPTRK